MGGCGAVYGFAAIQIISFLACITDDRVELCKLYPEQSAETRSMRRDGGTILACCSRHGLFAVKAQ